MRILGEKRGVMFFTVDALIAGVIFVLTVILLLTFLLRTPHSSDVKFHIDAYNDYITNTKMSQFKGAYKFIYYDANEPNPDLFVHEKILLMDSTNVPDATIISFITNFTSVVLPEHVGIEYRIDDKIIYEKHENLKAKSDILLSTSILTFVVDEDSNFYGPNVTKITVWV